MADHETANKRAWAGVQAIFERYFALADKKSGNDLWQLFDYDCMKRVKLIDVNAKTKTIVYEFTPDQKYANLNNVMHGGAYGVLFDMLTMSALGTVSKLNYWEFMGGVTRSINISYLRAIPVGHTVYFRSRVVQHGKIFALMHGEITDKDNTIVYATADHHKVSTPMLPEHRQIRIPFDDILEKEAEEEQANKKQQKNAKL